MSQSAGSSCCALVMPPHTLKKSVPSFIAGGHGEWSVPIVLTAPVRSRRTISARVASPRSGGAHLASAPIRTASSSLKTK